MHMQTEQLSQKQQDDKKRGMRISLFVHASILLIGILPLIRPKQLQPDDFQRAIAIKFDKPIELGAAKMSGSSGSASAMEEMESSEAESAPPRQKMEISELQPSQSKPVQSFELPERRQLITANTPDVVLPSSKTTTKPNVNFKPINERPEEFDKIPPFKSYIPEEKVEFRPVPASKDLEGESVDNLFDQADWANGKTTGTGSGSNSGTGSGGTGNADGGKGTGTGSGTGNAGTGSGTGSGSGDPGRDSGQGNQGKSMLYGDFAGDGIFNRKVLKRANTGALAKAEGKIHFKMCLNRDGYVVFAQADPTVSTINDRKLLAEAEKAASQMLWDKDPTAPEMQCGWFTMIFKFD